MKRIVLSFTVFLIITVSVAIALLIFRARSRVDRASSLSVKRNFVVEWDVVSPEEAMIPKLSQTQLLAEVEKSIKAHLVFRSWEAKYHVTSRQAPLKEHSIPEIIKTSQGHLISNGTRWLYEPLEKVENYDDKRVASNGKVINMDWPDRNEAMVKSNNQYTGALSTTTIADFLSCLPLESSLPKRTDFPDVFGILDAPNTELLPWYTRVNGHTCYVLERTTTLQHPLFRNEKELESWKKANPEETEAWSKAGRYGVVFNIHPQGIPGGGDTRVIEMKFRLAIAPKLGFAIIRWAYGYGSRIGGYQGFVFPDREIEYDDFRKVSKDLFIPHHMVYTHYRIDRHGQKDVMKETRLTVDDFTFNKQYEPELFEFDFPKGYQVIDEDRGILYTVGDSKETIDTLVAAAKAREAFYKKLSQTQAPAFEPSEWLNRAPIVLAEQKGRAIILHFWSLDCAPCMYELPRLQKQYGRTVESSWEPLFISIHPFIDGQNLSQLKKVIKKHGITFPVMVDSGCTGEPFWGKTFKKYMVISVPTEITIDETGHISEIPEDLINTHSRWMKKLPK